MMSRNYTRSVLSSVYNSQRTRISSINSMSSINHFRFYSVENKKGDLREEVLEQQGQPHNEPIEEEYSVDVSNLPGRWLNIPGEDQQDIINYLNVKQEFGWNYLTKDEKMALYYLSYGNWGPRDAKALNLPELIFKILSSSLLFGVLGFSIINYAIDKEKVAGLETQASSESSEGAKI